MPLNVTHTHTSAPSFPHWPKKTSFPNLVAARQHLPALLETPPLWLGNKRMKKEKNRKKKSLRWFHAWGRMEEGYLASSAIA